MSRRHLPVAVFGLLCCVGVPISVAGQDAKTTVKPAAPRSWFLERRRDAKFMALYERVVAAIKEFRGIPDDGKLTVPDFPPGKDWFNSPPLSLRRELKGKVVVLDFWTYCCINCIHVLPDLLALEKQYAGFPVAFVGVHSAKFENERVSENVRQAVLRYEIEHPVINDDDMTLWRGIGVRSWPTLAVIDPNGILLQTFPGEGNKHIVDACIAAILETYPPQAFRHDPVPSTPEKRRASKRSPLRFPGKLAIDDEGGRLFISDSNHNRIVVTDLEGRFLESIGSGRIGLDDGTFDRSTFNRLQGLAFDAPYLYVADAENHALRRVDLEKRVVTTLAGNGVQGHDRRGGKSGVEQQLSTPWDVVVHKREGDGEQRETTVFIAMAGTHQLWTYVVETGVSAVFSGDGTERNLNSEDPLAAAWAQPSGLTIGRRDDATELYVADSESSTVRAVDLQTGATRTIVGGDEEPRNLFAFGDQDGVGIEARLQHALGVLWHAESGRIITADTYNHRLKLVDPKENRIESWVGTSQPGFENGRGAKAQFSEPSGFAFSAKTKKLFVADANNHAVRVIDLSSGVGDVKLEDVTVETLNLEGVPGALSPEAPGSRRIADLPGAPTIRVEPLKLAPGAAATLKLRLRLPEDNKYTAGAASRWQLLAAGDSPVTVPEDKARGALDGATDEIAIPLEAGPNEGSGVLRLEALAYFCKDAAACRVGAVLFEIPVEISVRIDAKTPPASVSLDHSFSDGSGGLGGLLRLPEKGGKGKGEEAEKK